MYGTETTLDAREQVLAQEYLTGVEFVVCTLSYNNQHYITSVWKSEKRLINDGENKARDYLQLVSPDNPDVKRLALYMRQVLTCLGVSHGACNSDVIIDADRGPLLLEVNPRVPGGFDPLAFSCGLGINYIDQVINWSLYAHEEQYRPLEQVSYKLKNNMVCVSIIADHSGNLQSLDLSPIHQLDSCLKVFFKYKVGDYVHQTSDISNVVAMIYLCHQDEKQLFSDLKIIRDWEENTFNKAIISQDSYKERSVGFFGRQSLLDSAFFVPSMLVKEKIIQGQVSLVPK